MTLTQLHESTNAAFDEKFPMREGAYTFSGKRAKEFVYDRERLAYEAGIEEVKKLLNDLPNPWSKGKIPNDKWGAFEDTITIILEAITDLTPE